MNKKEFDLPLGYGDNKIVLMVRDPWTLFAYWEVQKEVEDGTREEIRNQSLVALKSILRVFEITGNNDGDSKAVLDFELKNWANNWYVHIPETGKKWMVQLGILCTTGEFFSMAHSNIVMSPINRMSDVLDEEWLCPEELYYKMFAAAAGYDTGKSSFELKELIEKRLEQGLFSGGISSEILQSAGLLRKRQ